MGRDPRQWWVTEDRRVMTRAGELLRIVAYTDPLSGESFEFLTNEPDLSPGVVAEVYRRRWNVEKVFDEIKIKLGEKKAWGTAMDAKKAQASRAEDARRAKRAERADQACAASGTPLNPSFYLWTWLSMPENFRWGEHPMARARRSGIWSKKHEKQHRKQNPRNSP